jgi:hypothetical protein
LKEFNDFTYGREVELFTDHEPLTTFKTIKNTSSRLNKLIMKIQEIAPDVTIRYKPGHLNIEADMLSRANINQVSLNSNIDWPSEQAQDPNLASLKSLLTSHDQNLIEKWSNSSESFKKRVAQIFNKLELENNTIKYHSDTDAKLIFVPKPRYQKF